MVYGWLLARRDKLLSFNQSQILLMGSPTRNGLGPRHARDRPAPIDILSDCVN